MNVAALPSTSKVNRRSELGVGASLSGYIVGSHSSIRRSGFLNMIGGNLVAIVVVVVTVVV